jgi:c-di-GMP-related signal transduction protein
VQRYLARQPIFDGGRLIFGYEILFRSGPENYFSHPQPDIASATAGDNVILFGLERLAQGKRLFINCTREFLVRELPKVLPKDRVVLEVLETVAVDEELVAACRDLKQAGYQLALDDYCDASDSRTLLSLADFVKVDVLATCEAEQERLAREFSRSHIQLVAEKVESYEVFEKARGLGYRYFQGYFFSRPESLTHRDIPANMLNHLLVLQAANRVPLDLEDVAQRIKAETSLSYRLLRYLNSAAFPMAASVHSIPHALRLLGERGTRRWVSLVTIAAMAEGKPEELVVLPVMRARFCELIAPLAGLSDSANDLFLLGLLSAMDAILDMPMADVLKEISVGLPIRDALLGRPNPPGKVLALVKFYERGDFDTLEAVARDLGIDVETIPRIFLEAMDWTRGVLRGA